MSVTAVCGGCQKTFKAPDEYAGKRVKCKNCGTAFRVPDAARSAGASANPGAAAAKPKPKTAPVAPTAASRKPAAAAATPTKKKAAPAPVAVEDDDRGEYGLSGDDDWALQPAAPAPQYTPTAAAVAPAPAYRPSGGGGGGASASVGTLYPTHAQPMSARRGAAAAVEDPNKWFLYVQLGVFGFPLLLMLLGAVITPLATVGILAATLVGMGFMLWGQIGILICAARESSACALLYMFVPLYPLYYILTRFEDVAPYLIRTVAGIALFVGAMMMILSQEQ